MNTIIKDKDGISICSNCETPVLWEKSKAGKWYLVTASKNLVEANTLYEYGWKYIVAVVSKVPHFKSCETFRSMHEYRQSITK
jgi:hypothetical protein